MIWVEMGWYRNQEEVNRWVGKGQVAEGWERLDYCRAGGHGKVWNDRRISNMAKAGREWHFTYCTYGIYAETSRMNILAYAETHYSLNRAMCGHLSVSALLFVFLSDYNVLLIFAHLLLFTCQPWVYAGLVFHPSNTLRTLKSIISRLMAGTELTDRTIF